MPSPCSEDTMNIPEKKSTSPESALTESTKNRIVQLSLLKHRRSLEQQKIEQQLPQQRDEPAETMVQSYDQPIAHKHENLKPTTTTRYTISGKMSNTAAAIHSPTNPSTPSTARDEHVRMEHHPTVIAEFKCHSGEVVTMTPPIIGNDFLSRLDGLRQFRDWSQRIHDCPKGNTPLATIVAHRSSGKLVQDTLTVERYNLTQPEKKTAPDHDWHGHVHTEDQFVEKPVAIPPPYCGPQIMPAQLDEARGVRQVDSAAPSIRDLYRTPLQEAVICARPRTYSKTVVISSETPNLQLTPLSKATSRTTSSVQLLRPANSKPKTQPPISFPGDFYERFPAGERSQTSTITQPSRPRTRLIPSFSSKTITASPSTNQAAPENNESLFISSNNEGRPEFYTMAHYFTECPHFSPPANRPLDAKGQPRQDPDFEPTKRQPTRSIIPGSCFACDIANRRDREDEIIDSCTARLGRLADELAEMLNEIELGDSDDDEETAASVYDKHSARLHATTKFAEDEHDLDHDFGGASELPPLSDDPDLTIAPSSGRLQTPEQKSYLNRLILRVRELEVQIENVRQEQEEQITKVWSGFTPRWGPGTLGVQGHDEEISTHQDTSADFQQRLDQDHHDPVIGVIDGDVYQNTAMRTREQEGRSVRVGNDGSSTISRVVSQTRSESSRSRSRSRSRSGTPTTNSSSVVSARDVPGSRTPGEGKMKIGWIREGRSQA